MKAILIFLSMVVLSTNAYSKSLKVAVKSFSAVVQIDSKLVVTDLEMGLGMTTCSWGWCSVRPNAFEKLIPLEVVDTDQANTFVINTLGSAKISKFQSFTTMRSCEIGLRATVVDPSGVEHKVERVIFSHQDDGECKKSRVLTPILEQYLADRPISIRLVEGRVLIRL